MPLGAPCAAPVVSQLEEDLLLEGSDPAGQSPGLGAQGAQGSNLEPKREGEKGRPRRERRGTFITPGSHGPGLRWLWA